MVSNIHDYASPHVATDIVLFRSLPKHPLLPDEMCKNCLQVLLMKRKEDPFKGSWSLPGGFVNYDAGLEETVLRKLEQKTGVTGVQYLEQLRTYDAINRDERGRVVTVAYMGLMYGGVAEDSIQDSYDDYYVEPPLDGLDGMDYAWFGLTNLLYGNWENGQLGPSLDLAFDHIQIIRDALERLRVKAQYSDILTHLLPPKFTLSAYQRIYEAVLGQEVKNFRRWVKPFVKSAGMFAGDIKLQFRTPELYTRVSDSEQIVFK